MNIFKTNKQITLDYLGRSLEKLSASSGSHLKETTEQIKLTRNAMLAVSGNLQVVNDYEKQVDDLRNSWDYLVIQVKSLQSDVKKLEGYKDRLTEEIEQLYEQKQTLNIAEND